MIANVHEGGVLSAARYILPLLSLLAMACKPPPDDRHEMPGSDAARGLKVIETVGCGACHAIPGLRWPRGGVAPALAGFADQALIAGELPNRPDVLAAYVRNAPMLLPDSTMPAMPISENESRDVAAYLYTLTDR